jgi:translation initiation factor IF-3
MRINRDIRVERVLLIDDNGKNLGNVLTVVALSKAFKANLDLVEVNNKGDIPVCRIMDYGKWKYDQSKKFRKNKSQRLATKEVKFRPNIGSHDLNYRSTRTSQFLKDGHRVKLIVRFRGREVEHMYDTGRDLLEKFLDSLEVSYKLIGNATIEGRTIVLLLGPHNE